MKTFFNNIYNWLEVKKQWLSKKLPVYPKDKAQHYQVVRMLTWAIGIWALGLPYEAFIALSIIFVACVVWELPSLIKSKFSKAALHESLRDFLMAFLAGGLIWLHLYQKLFLK